MFSLQINPSIFTLYSLYLNCYKPSIPKYTFNIVKFNTQGYNIWYMGYFDKDPSEYDFKAFDIETTGFGAHDTLTTLTLEDDGTYHIWINADGRDANVTEIRDTVATESGETVQVYVAEDATELLESVQHYIEENFNSLSVLVAYNGETWKGGFDLQFLRTACLRNGVDWIFDGINYMDIYPIYGKKNRFNTEVPSHKGLNKTPLKEFADWMNVEYNSQMSKSEIQMAVADTQYDFRKVNEWVEETDQEEVPTYDYNDQVGVYQALTDKVHTYDPWTDSANAVTAFESGKFANLILHNLADVVKTKELTDIAIESVSQDDLSMKEL